MPLTQNFPQLPRTVWRGVWDIFRRTPRRKLEEKALAAELNVQPAAARQYIRELAKVGLVDDDGSPTDLANRWRQDGQDAGVIQEMLERAYPAALRELAPADNLDRDKVVRWFMNEGLGEGSAKNRAATYLMVASGVSDEPPPRLVSSAPAASRAREPRRPATAVTTTPSPTQEKGSRSSKRGPQLAVNIQIHISADATAEQIDAIFSAMRAYFDDE